MTEYRALSSRVQLVEYLPKVGEAGLQIQKNELGRHTPGNLGVFSLAVRDYMIEHNLRRCWYQIVNDQNHWEWNHGIVELDEELRAVVTQVG